MNTVKNLKLENEVYEAPKCEIIEMESEGMLCLSDGYPNPGYGRAAYEDYEYYEW